MVQNSIHSFYVLRKPVPTRGDPFATDFLSDDSLDDNVGDAPECPKCGKCIGMLRWLPPYRGELTLWGKDFADIVFSPGMFFIISARKLWQEAGFTGLQGFEPVEISKVKYRSRARPVPGKYFHVTVVQSEASINDAESRVVRRGPVKCDWCFSTDIEKVERVVINPRGWREEDVFIARGLWGVYVTSQRFARWCRQQDITGAYLLPSEQYSYDYT
jgi:hypothetical protein